MYSSADPHVSVNIDFYHTCSYNLITPLARWIVVLFHLPSTVHLIHISKYCNGNLTDSVDFFMILFLILIFDTLNCLCLSLTQTSFIGKC